MIYVKHYDKRAKYGITVKKHYQLELDCLKRLKGCENMCQLIDYNRDKLTLDLEWCGLSYGQKDIRQYRKQQKRAVKTGVELPDYYSDMILPLTQRQFIDQWHSAFDQLESNNIVHLDLQSKNVCLNRGHLTVIDFGLAVLDGDPVSEFLDKKYGEFIAWGGYAAQRDLKLTSILKDFDNRRLTWL